MHSVLFVVCYSTVFTYTVFRTSLASLLEAIYCYFRAKFHRFFFYGFDLHCCYTDYPWVHLACMCLIDLLHTSVLTSVEVQVAVFRNFQWERKLWQQIHLTIAAASLNAWKFKETSVPSLIRPIRPHHAAVLLQISRLTNMCIC